MRGFGNSRIHIALGAIAFVLDDVPSNHIVSLKD